MITEATREPYGPLRVRSRSVQVYIAASWADAAYVRLLAHLLARFGVNSTSRWADFEQAREYGDLPAQSVREDLHDIERADAVVVFSERISPGHGGKGGRWIEMGYALRGKQRVFMVGTPRHIFDKHPLVTTIPFVLRHVSSNPGTEGARNEMERLALLITKALDKAGLRS